MAFARPGNPTLPSLPLRGGGVFRLTHDRVRTFETEPKTNGLAPQESLPEPATLGSVGKPPILFLIAGSVG